MYFPFQHISLNPEDAFHHDVFLQMSTSTPLNLFYFACDFHAVISDGTTELRLVVET